MGPRGQEPNESTDDAVWQDLVARLEGTSEGDPGQAPAGTATPLQADVRGNAPGSNDAGPGVTGRPDLSDRERAEAIFRNQPFAAAGPRDYDTPDGPEEGEGFVPDEPPPLGSGNPLTVLAWVGAAGGPLVLLLITMFWRSAPLGVILGVLAVFLAGAAYLVTKLPKHRDLGDDGAEV